MYTNETIASLKEELKAIWPYRDEHNPEINIMHKKIFLMNKEKIGDCKLDQIKENKLIIMKKHDTFTKSKKWLSFNPDKMQAKAMMKGEWYKIRICMHKGIFVGGSVNKVIYALWNMTIKELKQWVVRHWPFEEIWIPGEGYNLLYKNKDLDDERKKLSVLGLDTYFINTITVRTLSKKQMDKLTTTIEIERATKEKLN